ncbi:hypothetical protein QS306_00230 [Paraburkholderia bonniea]|uniref:tetratricopeptide repeat protein n=1 Tax=Paraburkholderia bonniea TaxID=2152891 RepID=UPI001292A297|nr:hypothetical protein [Paraburkholderia bonniea]WJF90160.1 hypothetical protein QS306_00230 [Paraburkholderia bonniea]WJF93474.1 hypothetical protein QS308_00230 [Paraburkholderia bonniea]
MSSSDANYSGLPIFTAFLNHADEAQQQGRAEVCATWLQAASYFHPVADADLEALALQLSRDQQQDAALKVIGSLASMRPDSVAAQFLHGYLLQLAGLHAEALAPYQRALELNPDHPKLRNNLASALQVVGESVAVRLQMLESAAQTDPTDVDVLANLMGVRRESGDLPRALEDGRRALELDPDHLKALNNYSLVLKEAQLWEEAERCARHASELVPDEAIYRLNLSLLQLVRGNYAEGWLTHEARWLGAEELRGNRPPIPGAQWRGEPLAGKTLLVWGEQGDGDLLQFCRFIPLLAERVHRDGGRIVWNSFAHMGALLERNLGTYVDAYSSDPRVEALPSFDYELSLASAPLVLDTRVDTIPAKVPYLAPLPEALAAWRQRLAGEKRLKVGLTWTGSLRHQRNPFRRVGWERYAEYFGGMDNVVFYSLQPGAQADVAAAREAGFEIVDFSAEWRSFDDTAAFASALDLVITVCTSVAHLSGALGLRTWVLLDVNPHWTWLLEHEDTPWYPTARLYRQAEFLQWGPVFERVKSDLTALAAQHRPSGV